MFYVLVQNVVTSELKHLQRHPVLYQSDQEYITQHRNPSAHWVKLEMDFLSGRYIYKSYLIFSNKLRFKFKLAKSILLFLSFSPLLQHPAPMLLHLNTSLDIILPIQESHMSS